VTDDTVKATEQREAVPIAARKHFAEFNALLAALPSKADQKPIEAEGVGAVELNPGMGLESQ